MTLPCPSCGGTGTKEWARKNGHVLVRCTSCRLIYVSNMPSDTATIYDETYFSGGDGHGYVDYDRDKEPMKYAFEKYLDHIESTLGRKGNLLDVGCATGYFMDIAKRRGWEVEGVEIADSAASTGRSRGFNIHTGILENLNLPAESFDVITLFDVVEHLRDPQATMREVARILKKGGVVAVTTPDAGSLWARMLGPKWHLVVPPEHLVYFSRKNFADLILKFGLKMTLVTTIGKRFTVPYIFQTLFHWQKLSIWNTLAHVTDKGFVSKLKIPINLHDTFFMVAKKQ